RQCGHPDPRFEQDRCLPFPRPKVYLLSDTEIDFTVHQLTIVRLLFNFTFVKLANALEHSRGHSCQRVFENRGKIPFQRLDYPEPWWCFAKDLFHRSKAHTIYPAGLDIAGWGMIPLQIQSKSEARRPISYSNAHGY